MPPSFFVWMNDEELQKVRDCPFSPTGLERAAAER